MGLNSELDLSQTGSLIEKLYNSDMPYTQLDCPVKDTLVNVHLEINFPGNRPDLYVQAN